MPKDLRTYLDDLHELLPDEVISVDTVVNPAQYDCTAIIKKLDALKKFPVITFERPLNLQGEVANVRLMLAELDRRGARDLAAVLDR